MTAKARMVRPGTQLQFETLEDRSNPVSVRFDYSLDTSGFFNSAERRAAMDRVATAITQGMTDTLQAIAPGDGNSWTAKVYNAVSNSIVSMANPTIGQNEILVYVVAGSMSNGSLALASGGAYSSSGSTEWLNTVRNRGQSNADIGADHGPWGGMIAVNTNINWDFTAGSPRSNQYDFDAVLTHELMHIFGFGLETPSFNRLITGGRYNGVAATTVYGGSIPMQADSNGTSDHFAQGVRYGGQESIMVPAIGAGVQKTLTALEYAALRDIGWEYTPVPASPPASPPPASQPVSLPSTTASPIASTDTSNAGFTSTPGKSYTVLVGSGDGSASAASGYNGRTATYSAMGLGSGARVATGDLDGDGYAETVLASGPGSVQYVTVLDGKTGGVKYSFQPFESGFSGGLYVAIGDAYGNGRGALAVGAGATGGPRVRVFNEGNPNWVLSDYFAIEDTRFSGGVRVAFGDLNNDGKDELVVAAGQGGGPRIAVYDGRTLRPQNTAPSRLIGDFVAFEPGLNNGAYVALGDINGDGSDDLIVGAGEGGGARTKVYDGRRLATGDTSAFLADFFSGDPYANVGTGVRVASADVDGDGLDDIVTGLGPKSDGTVRIFLAKDILNGRQTAASSIARSDWAMYGAFVG